jgi:vibriolysin
MKSLLLPLAIFVLCSNHALAAEKRSVRELNNINASISAEGITTKAHSLNTMLGLSPMFEQLKVRKKYLDKNGVTTTRYTQIHKGVPVIGDDIIISQNKSGEIKRAHGYVVHGIIQDIDNVNPSISSDEALNIAKEDSKNQSDSNLNPDSFSYENETSQLAIWVSESGISYLVYEVSFMQNSDNPSRPHYIIDATNGEVLDYYDNLQHANATGPGGNQKTGIYRYGTNRGYLNVTRSSNTCTMNNQYVRTIDLEHGSTNTQAFRFTCPENTHKQINGAYSPLNDAHYFGGVVVNMYRNWIHTNPLTTKVILRVHYGNNYENAFWNGTNVSFGDGNTRFYPLVSLDVVSHEISHGFTEQNSGLVYRNQSGGLNESFSDMAGEAAEYYSRGRNDWVVGADIFRNSGGLRYMNNPTADGRSIDHQSDYHNGLGVHYSSGVYNKAFYNLATSSGWNTKKAFQVYARANRLYWSAGTNWDDAGSGVMDAACDLGFDTSAVQRSLARVGIESSLSPRSVCRIVATAYIDSRNAACAWYANNYVSCGATTNLDSIQSPIRYSLPAGYSPSDIVDIAWLDAEAMACAWYRNGKVSCGSIQDLDSKRKPYNYTLPSGYTSSRVRGIGWIPSHKMACAWYNNNRVSCGTTRDLDSKRTPYSYTLPPSYRPNDILGMGWVTQKNMACAWYDNGNVSCGSTRDLDSKRPPRPYTTAN